jgi:hypothetical protein
MLTFIFFSAPLPCIVSDWSDWSAPDATGTSFRYRMVTRPAINGGKECPELIQARKGRTGILNVTTT